MEIRAEEISQILKEQIKTTKPASRLPRQAPS